MKKLLCFLSVLLLLLSVSLPVFAGMSTTSCVQVVSVKKGESFDRQITGFYNSLEAALQNAGDGDVIEVFDNVSVSAPITVPEGVDLTFVSGTKREHAAIFGQSAFEYTDPNAVKRTVTKTFEGALFTLSAGSRVTFSNLSLAGGGELLRVEQGGSLILNSTVTLPEGVTVRAVQGASVTVNGKTYEASADVDGFSLVFEAAPDVPGTDPAQETDAPKEKKTIGQTGGLAILFLCVAVLYAVSLWAIKNKSKQPGEGNDSKHFYPSVKWMRFLLMLCAILYTYGSVSGFGDLNSILFGFSFPALFMICGFVVLRPSPNMKKRLARAIRRTALCFVTLFAADLTLSLIVAWNATLSMLATKKFWFDLLALNVCGLPIGSTIWFVQALLYAYVILYLLCRTGLLDYDVYIAVACLAAALVTGELASVVGFSLLGHTYIGGNFLTRALPYLLLGGFVHRKKSVFSRVRPWGSLLLAVLGIALSVAEFAILKSTGNNVYVGHLLGMALTALGVCLLCFFPRESEKRKKAVPGMDALMKMPRIETMLPYFVCSAVYYALALLVLSDSGTPNPVFRELLGVNTALLSFCVLFLFEAVRRLLTKKKKEEKKETTK